MIRMIIGYSIAGLAFLLVLLSTSTGYTNHSFMGGMGFFIITGLLLAYSGKKARKKREG